MRPVTDRSACTTSKIPKPIGFGFGNGGTAPKCNSSNCENTTCFKLHPAIGSNIASCNPKHPSVDENFCQYGPSFSYLGMECRLCPHPNVVNERRTACATCREGEGPNINHDKCVPCIDGTKSDFGVCQPCPAGSTSNLQHTECVDVDECAIDNGGCDEIATIGGGPCINTPYTANGYQCGTCFLDIAGSGCDFLKCHLFIY